MLTAQQVKSNEEFFIFTFSMTKIYIWKDKGNTYIKQENGKFKTETLKGYVDIAEIVSKDFMDKYIELNSIFDRRKIDNEIFEAKKKKKNRKKNKKNRGSKRNF